MQLDDALLRFRAHILASGRSVRTADGYEEAVRRALASMGVQWASVTPIDLAEWRRRRAESVKPATVNLEVDALRQFYRWALSEGHVPDDPTTRLKHLPEAQALAPRWLTRQEQHRLLRAVQRAAQSANTDRRRMLATRDAALVALMLHAGLRVSEAVGLDLSDVALSERVGRVTVRRGKGGKRREVPLNRDARAALSGWLSFRGMNPGPLFPGDNGDRLSVRAAEAAVARLGRAAGVEVTPHVLRHTFCHELVERGKVPLDRVALLAGHTTASGRPRVETTVRYTTPSREELERAVEAIEWE
jgi:site-specific recombinase XerD